MAEVSVNNGVNVGALLAAREALKSAPEAAKFTWRASCKWQNGTHSQTKVEGFHGLGEEQKHKTEFSFEADHPEVFASEDLGATPVEMVLVGLASCLTAGVAAVAQNRGIQLRSVEAKLEGSMDIQGILGIDSDVRNGYDDIKVTFKIDADASKKEIEALVAQSQKRSAVYDIITNPTNVTVEVALRACARRSALAERAELAIEHVTTVVIGAGHAGLATSRCLTERSIDHVVLERGEVANSWRRERWDSLRLLTPNWQSRLPGYRYEGADADGFMTMSEVIEFISRFAVVADAPVRTHTTVTSVRPIDGGYHVATEQRRHSVPLAWCWRAAPATSRTCRRFDRPCRRRSSASRRSTTAIRTSCPTAACWSSARPRPACSWPTKIHRSGRRVTLSVGEHVRLPRTYRGRDVLWWMDASGVWNQRYDEIDDLTRARRLPSPQLVGTPERTTLDLNALSAAGVEIVGRLAAVRDGRALFSGGLRNQFALADLKMDRLLDTFDEWARTPRARCRRRPAGALRADPRAGLVAARSRPAERRDPFDHLGHRVSPRLQLARRARGRSQGPPAARWRRRRCARAVCVGLPVLRRRKSSFIYGAEDDARDLVEHSPAISTARPPIETPFS